MRNWQYSIDLHIGQHDIFFGMYISHTNWVLQFQKLQEDPENNVLLLRVFQSTVQTSPERNIHTGWASRLNVWVDMEPFGWYVCSLARILKPAPWCCPGLQVLPGVARRKQKSPGRTIGSPWRIVEDSGTAQDRNGRGSGAPGCWAMVDQADPATSWS